MPRLACLVAFSFLFVGSCAHTEDVANKSPSVASTQQRAGQPQQGTRLAVSPALKDIIFIDADTVLVFPGYLEGISDEANVNSDRVPLITQDGGESWEVLSAKMIEFTSVSFNNRLLGWLVNQQAELRKTTDGGESWTLVSKIQNGKETLALSSQVEFTDELNGWILEADSLWHTEDGGQTWLRHEFNYLLSQAFFHGNTVWVASQTETGHNNIIYRSQDNGKGWDGMELHNTTTREFLKGVDIQDIFFLDEHQGWLANTRSVYHTTDGGENWKRQRLPARELLIKSLHFLNQQEGWAAGWKLASKENDEFEAVLLHTVNGGEIWQQVAIELKETRFDNVYFGNPENGWLVSPGEALRDASIYRTRDRGISWKRVLTVKSPYSSTSPSEQ